MSRGAAAVRRQAWLELLETTGPFLTVPVADQVWPAGLPAVPSHRRAAVRAAVAGLLAAPGSGRDRLVDEVLCGALGWGDALVAAPSLPATLAHTVPEHRVVVRPDFAFRVEDDPDENAVAEDDADGEEVSDDASGPDEDAADGVADAAAARASAGPWRLLGTWLPWDTHPLARTTSGGWTANAVERLAALLRAQDVPIGLTSDGRWWALVHAPRGKPVGVAVWDASLWSEEPETLAGFVALLDRRRFVGVAPDDRLPRLLERSAQAQEEVTTALGAQVRAAVEMLVRRLDELDRETGGRILRGVTDDDFYAGVVTVMMRVVFLLFAEERRLLPSDDERYAASYSVGRLAEQLEHRAATHGRQTLEHRTGAWHRLLALSRALHDGVAHPDLRLPPYGGGLFDPERYPWLGDGGHAAADQPPPAVDDLTVLHVLKAVQDVTVRGELRRLSFRALDVEQIGYVYEGLLELEVRTADEPVLQLARNGGVDFIVQSTAAEIVLGDPEEWAASVYLGRKTANATSRKRASRLLAGTAPASVAVALRELTTETDLSELAPLVRLDDRDRPLVVPTAGRYIAVSSRRATTGAHYTPRFLAEEVVRHTLEPLAYDGPLRDLDPETWRLLPARKLLELKIADIAMGSGAFLVAACRWLADRVVDAWSQAGDLEARQWLASRADSVADAEVDPIVLRARREVAQHCLYGVDVNPLAVEMAKLSLWLITMDKERPFGFLDDRLVCGDSLLGLTSIDQLETLHMDPVEGRRRRADQLDFTADWRAALREASDERSIITDLEAVNFRDIQTKYERLARAHALAAPIRAVANALTGAGVVAAGLPASRRGSKLDSVVAAMWQVEQGDDALLRDLELQVDHALPKGKEERRPLHWPLAFPEVFVDTTSPGFDGIIGNPPFLGGQKISAALGGDYLAWLQTWDGSGVKGSADLSARFCLRANRLLKTSGQLGFVTNNTLLEGDTLNVGLLQLERAGWTVRRGVSSHPWPSTSANLSIVEVWATGARVSAPAVLDSEPVPRLGVDLQPFLRETGRPAALDENDTIAFQGSNVLGVGFAMEPVDAERMLGITARNGDVLFPYVVGADLNRRPDVSASRWIVNFFDWPLPRAETYTFPMDRVRKLVKPDRDKVNRAARRERWWIYAERAPELYETITDLDHVLAISRVGNAVLPLRVRTGPVFSEATVVFAVDDFASLTMLSSSAHQCWVIRYTSTMDTRIRYAPSDVFLTLPRPESTPLMHELGEALDTERRELMLGRALGLTKLYNQVHKPGVTDPAIQRLREIHAEIDHAVFAAYGWDDLDPEIGHHPTKIGTRWTVSPATRFELLDRLLVENHRRAAAQAT